VKISIISKELIGKIKLYIIKPIKNKYFKVAHKIIVNTKKGPIQKFYYKEISDSHNNLL